jgi:hypothetical protein
MLSVARLVSFNRMACILASPTFLTPIRLVVILVGNPSSLLPLVVITNGQQQRLLRLAEPRWKRFVSRGP